MKEDTELLHNHNNKNNFKAMSTRPFNESDDFTIIKLFLRLYKWIQEIDIQIR